MDCVNNKTNKECCGRTENINWSDKVRKMDKDLRSEMGIPDASSVEEILLSIQIKGSESLEPAYICCEDETFLDVAVLGMNGFRPTAVLKKDIQSIGVVGGKSPDDEEDSDDGDEDISNQNISSKNDFLKMYC